MKYKIISKALWEEQEEKCRKLGIDTSEYGIEVAIHFFNSPYFNDKITVMCVYDAIQCLAIKDGCDLVRWENGNYGFVAYCNGNVNGFEILS